MSQSPTKADLRVLTGPKQGTELTFFGLCPRTRSLERWHLLRRQCSFIQPRDTSHLPASNLDFATRIVERVALEQFRHSVLHLSIMRLGLPFFLNVSLSQPQIVTNDMLYTRVDGRDPSEIQRVKMIFFAAQRTQNPQEQRQINCNVTSSAICTAPARLIF